MGAKLFKIFEIVENKTGYEGRMKLAKEAGITMDKAKEVEDNPELIDKIKKLASKIIGEEIKI